ncbi:MAG: 30S ribosomal protein S8 [Candidatus Magasanikbacteria bacterium]
MHSDPIADMLTRIRNAQTAGKSSVKIPYSNLKKDIAKVLDRKEYVESTEHIDEGPQGEIEIELKYDNGEAKINSLQKVSVPGRRIYKSKDELPRVKNGYGIAIISTSQGVMTDHEARKEGVGGEVVCSVY